MTGLGRIPVITAVAVACLLPWSARAQRVATGQLLVAAPEITDANFSETVLLLIHHGDDGSLGIFLNRPTWVVAGDAFPEVPSLTSYEGTLYVGGPIAPTQLLVLIRGGGSPDFAATPVLADVQASADLELVALDAAGGSRVRLYAGHAAWAPGQLEEEIEDGSWRVVAGRSDFVFSADPLDLWQTLSASPTGELTVGLSR